MRSRVSVREIQKFNGRCFMHSDIVLDWLSVTFRIEGVSDISGVLTDISFLLKSDVKLVERSSLRGYPKGAESLAGLAKIGFNPERLDMGVHLSLSGQALQFFFDHCPSSYGPLEFLTELATVRAALINDDRESVNFTRIDLALDDRDQNLDLEMIAEYCRRKWRDGEASLTSRFRNEPLYYSGLGTGGTSIYFGDKSSQTRVRLYDKASEQKLDSSVHWIRCEMQFRQDRADEVCRNIVFGDGVDVVPKLLLGLLDFKSLGSSAQLAKNRPSSHWWARFLGTFEKTQICVGRLREKSIDKTLDWLNKQVAPSLAMINEVGMNRIQHLISGGMERLTDFHYGLIEQHEWKFKFLQLLEPDGGTDLADRAERRRFEQGRKQLFDAEVKFV